MGIDGNAVHLTVVASGPKRALYGGDVRLLEWYFTQYAFEKSTFGATLARQESRYRDSSGKVIPCGDDWSWVSGRETRRCVKKRPGRVPAAREAALRAHIEDRAAVLSALGSTVDSVPSDNMDDEAGYLHITHDRDGSPQPPMHVNEAAAEGQSEPDDEALTKHAQVSRRLLGVERLGRIHVHVLGAYYGNAGIAWQGFTNGRIWSLAPLTGTGGKMLARVMANATEQNPTKALAESVKGNAEGAIQREGEVLLDAAETAWRSTAPPRRDRREESRDRIRELRLVLV